MKRRICKKRTLFLFVALVLLSTAGPAFAFDLYINGNYRKTILPSSVENYTYPAASGPRFRAGISLLETLPLFTGVYKMEIEHAFGTETLEGDNLADRFCSWMLFVNPDSLDLETDGKPFRRVREIRVWGEELKSDSLRIWIGWEGLPELRKELDRFAALHNVSFDVLEVPSIDSKLTSAARSGGELPDLCMVQSDYLPALTEGRVLQRLDYLSLPGLLEKGTDAFRKDGSVWAVPFYFDTQLFFYNPKLLQNVSEIPALKPGWTLNDFEMLCAALLQQGITPITWNAYSAYWLIPFQIGFGKESVLEKDGSIIIDDAPTRGALHYITGLREKGYLDIRERDGMMSRFFDGKVAMILSGSYSIPEFENLGIPFSAAPYPYNSDTGKYISPLLDFKAFAITRKTKAPVLARRTVEYLSGQGVQQRFCTTVSKLPANTQAWSVTELQNPYYKALFESYKIGTVIPPEDSYKIYKNTMWKLLRFAITGEMTVEETLSEGQKIINNKLKPRRD